MTANEKLDFLQSAMRDLFKKDTLKLSLEDNLADLGLDSLDIVELQMYYEDKTGTEIADDNVPATVADLLAMMR